MGELSKQTTSDPLKNPAQAAVFDAGRLVNPLEPLGSPSTSSTPWDELILGRAGLTACIPGISTLSENQRFICLCQRVLELETGIVYLLGQSTWRLSGEPHEKFVETLTTDPVTGNLLTRQATFQGSRSQVVAGMQLGVQEYHLGATSLHTCISKAYENTSVVIPQDMQVLCREWALLQSEARREIIKAAWNAIPFCGTRPVPEWFCIRMARCLEHRSQGDPPESLKELENLLHELALLIEPGDSQPLAALRKHSTHIREQSHNRRASLGSHVVDALRAARLESWLKCYFDPNNPQYQMEFCCAVWPEGAVPSSVELRDGCIHGIVVTPEQALRFGSQYLAVPTLKTVRLSIAPPSLSPRSWARTSLGSDGMQPVPICELEDLALRPIAPLVTHLTCDLGTGSNGGAIEVWTGMTRFLGKLAECRSWRSAGEENQIRLVLTSPRWRDIDYLADQAPAPSREGDLVMHAAVQDSTGDNFRATVLAIISTCQPRG
jgi:hypothetical protein